MMFINLLRRLYHLRPVGSVKVPSGARSRHEDCVHCRTGEGRDEAGPHEVVTQQVITGCIKVACPSNLDIGRRQSPIDIVLRRCQPSAQLLNQPLQVNYENVKTVKLINGGGGWNVAFKSPEYNLSEGPVRMNYTLIGMHAHWGHTGEDGSEHTVEGRRYDGELHLVHFNSQRYKTFTEAACSREGLCVIAVFLKEGNENPEFHKICEVMDQILHKNDECNLKQINIKGLLPEDYMKYWTYEGSLTTSPYFESVTWIIAKSPITISSGQLNKFRALGKYSASELAAIREVLAAVAPSSTDVHPHVAVVKNFRTSQQIADHVVREPGEGNGRNPS